MSIKAVIIDYGVGNVQSLLNAFSLYCDVIVSKDEDVILSSDAIILPGVGSFKSAMNSVDKNGLRETLIECKNKNKYFLGICLGMQILFDKSEESPGVKGLGFIKGKIWKFDILHSYKIPNIGWNEIYICGNERNKKTIFNNIEKCEMYFCHSYYAISDRYGTSFSENGYINFNSSVQKKNIYGVQYHPEKSGKKGLTFIKNFVNIVNNNG